MSEPTSSSAPADASSLQFDRAEYAPEAAQEAPGKLQCAPCGRTLLSSYFELNGVPTCAECREKIEKSFRPRPGFSGFLKAAAFGLAGAAVGAGVYYAILALANLEVGLISILVGFLAGAGVHKGSGGYGGWKYQTLAVVLTYLAIVCTYIPMIYAEVGDQFASEAATAAGPAEALTAPAADSGKPPGWMLGIIVFVAALAAPFLAGFENILGLLIIGFGLYQAWKVNKAPVLAVAGPFQVGDQRFAQPFTASAAPVPVTPS
jgi:hypothetical protein